jgi:glycosyltransferase involved in cell wall biosynthesis
MRYADLILVNSNFTKNEVGKVFPSLMEPIIVPSVELSSSSSSQEHRIELGSKIKVLYPAIDLNKFISPTARVVEQEQKDQKLFGPIVSLNRFERKKNIHMLIEAYAKLLQRIHSSTSRTITEEEEELHPQRTRFVTYPPVLVIAGGYDPRNTENREYLEELKDACTKWNLHVDKEVFFRPSVSDDERATLLQSASCLCYTPHREHFGIVPLEAMYAGSPVIAVNSGGPRETVLHGVTGYLVENCSDGFCEALYDLIVLHPEKMDQFGIAGHVHITNQFGLFQFQSSWKALLNDCIQRSKFRCQTDRDSSRHNAFLVHWLLDLVIAFTLAFCARYILDSLDINVTNFTRWIK